MAIKKKSYTRVSPSRRAEGSRTRPVAKRVSPSMRKEGSKRVAPTSPSKIQESGVGNIPMTIAKGISSLVSRASAGRAATGRASTGRAAPSQKLKKVPVSKNKIEMKGKPTAQAVPYSTKLKTMSSEGSKISRGKKIGYGSLAGAGALGAAASRLQISVKPPVETKGSSNSGPKKGDKKTLGGRKAVYNGTNWVPVK